MLDIYLFELYKNEKYFHSICIIESQRNEILHTHTHTLRERERERKRVRESEMIDDNGDGYSFRLL